MSDASTTNAAMNVAIRTAAGKPIAPSAEGKVAALESENRALRLAGEVAQINRTDRLGILSEDDAIKLLPADAINYDANGRPLNVRDALRRLVREKPWLAGRRE